VVPLLLVLSLVPVLPLPVVQCAQTRRPPTAWQRNVLLDEQRLDRQALVVVSRDAPLPKVVAQIVLQLAVLHRADGPDRTRQASLQSRAGLAFLGVLSLKADLLIGSQQAVQRQVAVAIVAATLATCPVPVATAA
jgi:hypothetical protein